ncbi:hypothetical protein H311_03215 [Anncaliia algerae PRA109]|nr:hypothetical protein H311_03215 [Anncaliia algerae PRA109]
MMSNYQKIFDLYADSSNNTVKKADLNDMLLLEGHSVLASEMARINSDEITFEEFEVLVKNASQRDLTFECIKDAFEAYDPDQTGYVDYKDIKTLFLNDFGKSDDEGEDEFMSSVMPDKDGKVNYMALLKDFFESKEEDRYE